MVAIIKYIKHQRKKGYAPIILFVGKQRSGKTALALRIAYEVEKKFDIDKQMFFRIEDFANAYDKFHDKILILDEAGISLDPYEHMSITQRVYSHIVQSQAYKRNIVFLVLPFASEIGKNHRKHVSAIVHVLGRGLYSLYATTSWHPDLSFKPPRLIHVETVGLVPLPPPHIWDTYITTGQESYKKEIMDLQQSLLKLKKQGGKEKRVITSWMG